MAKKNVFDNERVEALTVEWKKSRDANTYQSICMGCLNLIEAIIRSKGFYRQAPFSDIRNGIFVALPKFLEAWSADRGSKLYSYLSSCITNACISFVKQDSELRRRYVFTDVALDTLGEDHEVTYTHIEYTREDIEYLRGKVSDIAARWREPVIRESLQYLVEVVIQNRLGRRQEILKSLVFGYKIPVNNAKFLLDWSIAAVRAELLDLYDSPLGEVDILRASEKFSYIPDMVNLVGFDNVLKLIKVFAGMSVKFPSLSSVKKALAVKALINSKNSSPDAVNSVARSFGLSPDKVQESFEVVSDNIASGVLHDTPLFNDSDDGDEDEDDENSNEVYVKDNLIPSWERVTEIPDFVKDFGMSEDEIGSFYRDD